MNTNCLSIYWCLQFIAATFRNLNIIFDAITNEPTVLLYICICERDTYAGYFVRSKCLERYTTRTKMADKGDFPFFIISVLFTFLHENVVYFYN